MKKNPLYLILIFILIFCIHSFAQQVNIHDTQKNPLYPYSLQIETLNSSGFLGTLETSVSDVTSGNPANLNNYEKISFGISYQFSKPFQNPFSYLNGTSVERKTDIIPQSIGIVYPLNDQWSFAAGFNQVYSNLMESEAFEVTTIEHPEGTGEIVTATNETRLFKYSLTAGYKVRDLLLGTDKLTGSFQIDFFHLKQSERFWHTKISYQNSVPTFSLGLNYVLNENWQFGIYGTPSFKIEGSFTYESDLKIAHDLNDPFNGGNNQIPETSYSYLYEYPTFIAGGYSYDSKSFWKTKMEFGYRYWHSIHNDQENELIISGNMIFRITDAFNLSTGIYVSDHQVDLENLHFLGLRNNPTYTRNYLSVGVNYKIEGFIFDGVIVDNQLLEPTDPIRTTQYKFGIGFEL